MNIKLVFTVPKEETILTKIIKFFQGIPTSHCQIIFPSDYGKRLVYESKGLGEHLVSFENMIEDNYIVQEFEIVLPEGFEIKNLFNHIYERIGYHYGYGQLIGYGWCLFMKKIFKKDVQNPFKDGEKSTTCHESSAIALRDVFKFTELNGLVFDNLDLKWFYKFCNKNERLIRVK